MVSLPTAPAALIMLSAELSVSKRGWEGGGGVSVVPCILGGCGCSAASSDLCNLSLCLSPEQLPECTLQE